MMRIASSLLIAITAVVLAVFGGESNFRAGQVHVASAGWARILRVQGIRRLASNRDQRERRQDRCDRGESGNDRRL